MHAKPADEHEDPSLGMRCGQVAGPDTLLQYHSGAITMHAGPPGGHCAQMQTSPLA